MTHNNPILTLLLALALSVSAFAQKPKTHTATDIYEAVQKLNVLGSVLYVAAHPDDENTQLISYFSNQVKARTAYLSLTRGDGGQNLIGPELRELLGVIRTQELLMARRLDGGQQWFTRANDFGYSKHPDETLSIWNKTEVLSDVVRAIRHFKPDVIINRFDHRTAGTTHGHHTASALLSLEAFDLANDASYQPKLSTTWQPQRLFFNTSWWFYGSQERFEKADKSKMLSFDVGTYFPLKGLSNNEIASNARSQHLSQGFGRSLERGSSTEYIELIKGDMPSENNVFDGIDTSWNRIDKGNVIGPVLKKVEDNFNFENPSAHLNDLLSAYKLLQKSNDAHWKTVKSKELEDIILACAGLYLEASATAQHATPDETVKIAVEVLNRSDAQVELVSCHFTTDKMAQQKNLQLKNNQKKTFEAEISIPKSIEYSSPYWLKSEGTLGMYAVENNSLIGQPESPEAVSVTFNLKINSHKINISKPVIYKFSKPDTGEQYKPFSIVPEVSVKTDSEVTIFESEAPKETPVTVKAWTDNVSAKVQLNHPDGWTVFPKEKTLNIAHKGETKTVVFTVTPPKTQAEGFIVPQVSVNGKTYSKGLIVLDYAHIPYQTVLLPAKSKVVRLDLKKNGKNIGYIEGAGDAVAENLQQIGYRVTQLQPETLSAKQLNGFDAVVVGIRAYNISDALANKQDVLFDYAKNGGNVIVQYNTSRGLKTNTLAPYDLTLSRDRVTDENAEVKLLDENHPLLNYPNKITEKDFEGWTQERGLYFPNEWNKAFTPLLSMRDKGESAKKGSLLVAPYGKGRYIYTGLSFFRELPAGVSGAYRLFANMLSMKNE